VVQCTAVLGCKTPGAVQHRKDRFVECITIERECLCYASFCRLPHRAGADDGPIRCVHEWVDERTVPGHPRPCRPTSLLGAAPSSGPRSSRSSRWPRSRSRYTHRCGPGTPGVHPGTLVVCSRCPLE